MKKKKQGKPQGMTYADMLAQKRRIKASIDEMAKEEISGIEIRYLYEQEALEAERRAEK